MPSNKKADYEKLRDIWYAKLKKTGFEDIEQDENTLKRWSSDKFGKNKGMIQNGGFEAKAAYYNMADKFTHDYKFENKVEKAIWKEHAKGISGVNIVKFLIKKKLVKKTNRHYVWLVVDRLRKLMLKMYVENPLPDEEENEQ